MMKFIFVILYQFLLVVNYFCESPDSAYVKILNNKEYISEASSVFDIDPKTLASIIFVERKENVSWEDDVLDDFLAYSGYNSSIGFCQIKLKTAYWIENQLADSKSNFYPGKKYSNVLSISKDPDEIIQKLNSDDINIIYAAAYLRIIQSRWARKGYFIENRPDIIGTLYFTGLFNHNGFERKPNDCPKANYYGKKVLENITLFSNMFLDN